MGDPIIPIPPVPPGGDCPACTPDPWPAGTTPSELRIVFHALSPCAGHPEPPNDIPIHCSQNPFVPCYFSGFITFSGVIWLAEINLSISSVYLTIVDPYVSTAFASVGTPCSPGPYANSTLCPLDAAQGGYANILGIVPGVVTLLADTYNIQPDPASLYDIVESATPDHVCVRLTGRTSPGSVLIDVDTTAIP